MCPQKKLTRKCSDYYRAWATLHIHEASEIIRAISTDVSTAGEREGGREMCLNCNERTQEEKL